MEMKNKLLLNKVSSPRNVVGDLPLTWLLSLSRHCGHGSAIQGRYKEKTTLLNRLDPGSTSGMTTTAKSAEDSRTLRAARHSGMTALFNCKAFTLIELLVVVLIIGILAAIALPQYRVAVEKANILQILSVIDTVDKAEQLFFAENGRYTSTVDEFESLVLTLPTQGRLVNDEFLMSGKFYCMLPINRSFISCYKGTLLIEHNLTTKKNTCRAKNDTPLQSRICKSLGGQPIDYPDSTYTLYEL